MQMECLQDISLGFICHNYDRHSHSLLSLLLKPIAFSTFYGVYKNNLIGLANNFQTLSTLHSHRLSEFHNLYNELLALWY